MLCVSSAWSGSPHFGTSREGCTPAGPQKASSVPSSEQRGVGAAPWVAGSGKRLPTMLKLSGTQKHRQIARGAPDGKGETDVEMHAGSSVTSEGSSIYSRSGGVHLGLGSAATVSHGPMPESTISGTTGVVRLGGVAEGMEKECGTEVQRIANEVETVRAENKQLREEVYKLLGAQVRAEQASKSYVRAVTMLAKSLVQVR